MSKFLNESGLSYFWGKVKDFLSNKYVRKGDEITVGNSKVSETNISTSELQVRDDKEGYAIFLTQYQGAPEINLSTDIDSDTTVITNNRIGIHDGKYNYMYANEAGNVTAVQYIKSGSDDNHVLLGGGGDLAMNVANGIAKLNKDGKLDASLVDIDTTLFEVVSALPTKDIVKNRIYLMKSDAAGTQNTYAEYIYTGDVTATYDASKWEKLGEYKSDVDLSDYSKKSETVKAIASVTPNETTAIMNVAMVEGVEKRVAIPGATQSLAGVMSGADKKALDTLTARYPLSISGISASPNLVEVGVAADVTFSWSIANEDFHPVSSQSISVAGGAAQTVAVGTKSYKQTALAGATTATTKSATVTIQSGSTTLTKDVAVTYHYPTYIGVMANGATVNETSVKALTKSIEWGKGKKTTLTQNNQIIVYAYPASYGDLTSVKDGNGFEGFAGYTKQTMTINGQSYNVYVQNIAATSSSTYTFA